MEKVHTDIEKISNKLVEYESKILQEKEKLEESAKNATFWDTVSVDLKICKLQRKSLKKREEMYKILEEKLSLFLTYRNDKK